MSEKQFTFFDYIKAAFSAKAKGMFIAPNWILLGSFALLGLVHWGFWMIGAGVELAYLLGVASNHRFQQVIRGEAMMGSRQTARQKIESLVERLSPKEQERYNKLVTRCRGILQQQSEHEGNQIVLTTQSEGLERLLWIFLRLQVTRQQILQILSTPEVLENKSESKKKWGRGKEGEREGGKEGREWGEGGNIEEKIEQLRHRLQDQELTEKLRKSLEAQVEILIQRQHAQKEARQKIDYIDAELIRISEQIELIREQAAIMTNASDVSGRIDAIGSTLSSTTEWITQQQDVYGKIEEMTESAPAILVDQRA